MKFIISLLALLLFYQPVFGTQTVTTETLAKGLGVPWGMAVMPDNTLLITQREGQLSQLNLKTGSLTSITGLPAIKVSGQGGLFDVALSPDYANSQWIYFTYSKDVSGQAATTLARAKLVDKHLVDWQDILVTKSTTDTNYHFGGRIAFDNNKHIFVSVGERGFRPNAQDLSTHAGAILRLNLDGSVPTDNPFVGNKNALPEIWSYGHRNPQGLFFNKVTNQLWESEHGPRGGDEINLIEAGKNYGWPIISYGKEYYTPFSVGEATEKAGMEQPVKVYIPSIATSSLIQYMGNAFPNWHNNLLIGALKSEHLNRIVLDQNDHAISETRLLRNVEGRIRNIIESPEGWLYVATDDGRILKISPALADSE
ncbi:MAG TPA: PQQ-dependent sugar dehydrogenase [Methylophaga sp.]|nr:PQQ-dependent sugar dehydrogenase [Methylophaga sp.]